MTDLNVQQILFGSGTPDGMQVELGNGTFTPLHEAVAGDSKDLVTIELCNRTGAALDYTIGWGGTANKDLIVGALAAKSGVVVVVDRRPLGGGLTVSAKASGVGVNAAVTVGRYQS